MIVSFYSTHKKFMMHRLGPYVIKYVIEVGVVQLELLDGQVVEGIVNGSWLKLYRDGLLSVD
jgi:hypothetical protein